MSTNTIAQWLTLVGIFLNELAKQGRKGADVQQHREWFRHYSATTAYCNGTQRYFYAVTFDTDPNDVSRELLNAILNATVGRCGNHEDTGYAIQTTEEGRNNGNTYPSIEVGEL